MMASGPDADLGHAAPRRRRQVLGEVLGLPHDLHRPVEVAQLEEAALELGHGVPRGDKELLARDPGLVDGDLPFSTSLPGKGMPCPRV